MKNVLKQYKWILTLWILCGLCHVSGAYAYDRVAQPELWEYKPVFSEDVRPAYQFQSTSPYSSVVGNTAIGSQVQGMPRRNTTDSWGEPEDDPIGVLPNPTPVGEPLIMLVLAVLFMLARRRKSKA